MPQNVSFVDGLDVPSRIDLRDPADAREWERTAQARPGRAEVFRAFARELRNLDNEHPRVLELGSGPAFLAAFLLQTLPGLRLALLDFSVAMHDLARARLGNSTDRVSFLERSFKDPDWTRGLGPFDAVITHQAVHELRHKRHAETLHAQVRGILKPCAPYLVCDHYFGVGGMRNAQLFMTAAEQRQALIGGGFAEVRQVVRAGSFVMHRGA
jgi:SAM-dependent methyltransferase